MCELYAMTSDMPAYTFVTLGEFRKHGGQTADNPDGWGLAYIMGQQVDIYREVSPASKSFAMEDMIEHHSPAKVVMSHIRKASKDNIALENTHPFTMELGGRHQIFMHNGDIGDIENHVELDWYKPKGSTDSEVAFGYLMEKLKPLYDAGEPSLNDRIEVVEEAFNLFANMGIANFLYHDGEYMYAFGSKRTQHNGKVEPPGLWHLDHVWNSDDHHKIKGLDIRGESHEQHIIATFPLTPGDWVPFNHNQLIVARDGIVFYT